MSILKTMTIDGFFTPEAAVAISRSVKGLSFKEYEFGKQIDDFNLVSEELDELFSSVLNFKVTLDQTSGFFRIPYHFIHFEPVESLQDWLFVVALEQSTFNVFEHKSGAKTALDGHQFAYRNLFDWDLKVNYILDPGQGVFFRPWLFHSFDHGLIQVYKLKE